MKINKLNTFVFTKGNKIISPVLTTIREYGKFLEHEYDEYTCNYELYIKANKSGGKVLEFHPGTKIGKFFDKQSFHNSDYYSWFIYQDSSMMDKLRKFKMAEYRDAIPISVTDEQGRRMLRVYTLKQIELYIKTNIDKDFGISDKYLEPKKIALRPKDMDKLIIPKVKTRRSLLDIDNSNKLQVTMKQIEEKFGCPISIVS